MRTTAFAAILVVGFTGSALAQTAPNAPQYQTGTTNSIKQYLPSGSTYGTALNGNTQVTVPAGNSNYYGFGQNASTPPSRTNPSGGYGGVVGVGRTF